jgi:hypothetical protein
MTQKAKGTSTINTPIASKAPEGSSSAELAVGPDGTIHMVWAGNSSGNWEIYYARSTDGGVTFLPPVSVDPIAAANLVRDNPALAVGPNGIVYIAWEDWRNNNGDIYCARSNVDGTFSAAIRVGDDTDGLNQEVPVLAATPNGTLYLAWLEEKSGDPDRIYRIYYTRAANGEVDFGNSLPIDPQTEGTQSKPTIGVDHLGRVHLGWADNRSGKMTIYHATADEGGDFGPGLNVGGGLMADLGNYLPHVAIGSDDSVHIVWSSAYIQEPTYHVQLYLPAYTNSFDRGENFAPSRQVGKGFRYVSTSLIDTAVAVTTSAVHVVFTTYSPRDGGYLWYYNSTNNGETFSEGVAIAEGSAFSPVVAGDAQGRILAAWSVPQHLEEGDKAQWSIYYSLSTDSGKTFSQAIKM